MTKVLTQMQDWTQQSEHGRLEWESLSDRPGCCCQTLECMLEGSWLVVERLVVGCLSGTWRKLAQVGMLGSSSRRFGERQSCPKRLPCVLCKQEYLNTN